MELPINTEVLEKATYLVNSPCGNAQNGDFLACHILWKDPDTGRAMIYLPSELDCEYGCVILCECLAKGLYQELSEESYINLSSPEQQEDEFEVEFAFLREDYTWYSCIENVPVSHLADDEDELAAWAKENLLPSRKDCIGVIVYYIPENDTDDSEVS